MLAIIEILVAGIPAIISGIIAFIARKAGTAAGSIAAFIFMTTAFIVCINSILNSLLSLLTIPSWLSLGFGMWVPGNFTACLSAIVSARICRAAYDMALDKVKLINSAN